jgi:hypothetical protein
MILDIPPIIQKLLTLPAKVDTDTLTAQQLEQLYHNLHGLSDRADELVKPDDREAFQDMILSLTAPIFGLFVQLNDPQPDQVMNDNDSDQVMNSVPQQKQKPKQKVAIPHKGAMKYLRSNFGKEVHEKMHFAPTDQKAYHGVWGGSLKQVRQWVSMAIDSIHGGDDYVVASKPGQKNGSRTYLVFMNTTVGYLSGSAMANKPEQLATHIEVYVDKNGTTVSAFPSDPNIF